MLLASSFCTYSTGRASIQPVLSVTKLRLRHRQSVVAMSSNTKRSRGPPSPPKPSASVLLFSPRNQVLLLARVKTSSSFASAYVFPGGNVDAKQDGSLPPPDKPEHHEDSETYRLAAIRECFEESGILLAKTTTTTTSTSPSSSSPPNGGSLLQVPAEEREARRQDVHAQRIHFADWVRSRGGEPDTAGLIPFTRFLTPTMVPRRFTTQMYVYFLPLDAGEEGDNSGSMSAGATEKGNGNGEGEVMIPTPTADGGVEHTAARFLWPAQWLELAAQNKIIMYPPQVFLCHLLAPFFPPAPGEGKGGGVAQVSRLERAAQRDRAVAFMRTGEPPWADKVISPEVLMGLGDGRVVLGLNKPGHELRESGRSGDSERVILQTASPEGPRDVQVRWKADVMREAREIQEREKEKGKGKL